MLKIVTDMRQNGAARQSGGPPELTQLLESWEHEKTIELTANARRQAIEQQLALVLAAPDEGQKSHRVGPFKVTRTNAVYYRGDVEKLKTLTAELGLDSLLKEAINETAVKRLKRDNAYDFELLMSEGALSTSVARPHFDVGRVATAILEVT